MTKFEKETRHWLYVFIKKKNKTTAGTHDRFYPLTQT